MLCTALARDQGSAYKPISGMQRPFVGTSAHTRGHPVSLSPSSLPARRLFSLAWPLPYPGQSYAFIACEPRCSCRGVTAPPHTSVPLSRRPVAPQNQEWTSRPTALLCFCPQELLHYLIGTLLLLIASIVAASKSYNQSELVAAAVRTIHSAMNSCCERSFSS